MTRFGYSLMCEEHHPNARVERGRRAEELGFDFLTVSDHFHPWLYSQRHSPYAWSLLGALAATTERVELVSAAETELVREEDVAERIPCGPDPGPVRELVEQWVDAGFDHVAIVPVGDDPGPFLEMWERDLRSELARA